MIKWFFRKLFIGSIIIILVFCLGEVASCESKVDQILKEIKSAAANIHSYQVNYNLQIDKNGEKVSSIGNIKFREPDKFYMEVELPDLDGMKQLFISNGDILWQYIPEMKMAAKLKLNEVEEEKASKYIDTKGDIRNPFGNMKKDSIKFIKEISEDGRKIYVLEAEPKEEVSEEAIVEISKAEIWIYAEEGIPKKVFWYNAEDVSVIEQEFKDIQINVEIDENKFNFSPPADVKVIDITEEEQ